TCAVGCACCRRTRPGRDGARLVQGSQLSGSLPAWRHGGHTNRAAGHRAGNRRDVFQRLAGGSAWAGALASGWRDFLAGHEIIPANRVSETHLAALIGMTDLPLTT